MNIKTYDEISVVDLHDASKIYDVLNDLEDCFYFDRYDNAQNSDELRMAYAEKLAKNAHVITAFYEEKPIGCWGVYMNNQVEGYMYATYCAVRPDLGISGGIALLKMFSYGVEIAKQNNMMDYILKVETRKDNVKAQRMCENLGIHYKGEEASENSIYMEGKFSELAKAVEVFSSKYAKRTKKLDNHLL